MAATNRLNTTTDHDLLIVIDTKLTALKDSVTALTQSTKDGLDKLNKDKANQDEVDALRAEVVSLNNALDAIKRKFWVGMGIMAAAEFFMRVLPNLRWVN